MNQEPPPSETLYKPCLFRVLRGPLAPRTWYLARTSHLGKLEETGRAAFRAYKKAMQQVLDDLPE